MPSSFLTSGPSWAQQRSQECLLLTPRQYPTLRNVEEVEGELTEKKRAKQEKGPEVGPTARPHSRLPSSQREKEQSSRGGEDAIP